MDHPKKGNKPELRWNLTKKKRGSASYIAPKKPLLVVLTTVNLAQSNNII